jgi:hypothetical protein
MKIRHLRGQVSAYFLGSDGDESVTADELVDERPSEWVATGLVAENGRAIYRRRPTVKFGFVP